MPFDNEILVAHSDLSETLRKGNEVFSDAISAQFKFSGKSYIVSSINLAYLRRT